MNLFASLFLRGLLVVLPLALTGYLVWAAVVAVEAVLHAITQGAFDLLSLPWRYAPWMGFAFSAVLVMGVGLLMYSFVARTVHAQLVALLNRIPVVKSIYGMLVDVVRLVGGDQKPFQQVVLVTASPGLELLGFLSRGDFADLQGFPRDHVAVYLPMSYQVGGFTVVVARSRVRAVPMKVEDALRFCVTAGVARDVPRSPAAGNDAPPAGTLP